MIKLRQPNSTTFKDRLLTDFTWWVYSCEKRNDAFDVQVRATENGKTHARMFTVSPEEETKQGVVDALLSLGSFAGSVETELEYDFQIVTAYQCARCENIYDEVNDGGLCINCTASESQSGDRKKRRGIIDRLVIATQGTQLENVVMALRLRYAEQTAVFEETGNGSELAIAVADETTAPYTNHLTISFISNGVEQTIKEWIISAVLDSPSFVLGGQTVSKVDLIDNLTFSRKETRNLNTAMDVYFMYNEVEYGVRFQDWNIFNVMSDEECGDKLQAYIFEHTSIEHPAA